MNIMLDGHIATVLNLWSMDHQWSAAICLVFLQAKLNIYLILRNKYSFSHKKWIFWGNRLNIFFQKIAEVNGKLFLPQGPP